MVVLAANDGYHTRGRLTIESLGGEGNVCGADVGTEDHNCPQQVEPGVRPDVRKQKLEQCESTIQNVLGYIGEGWCVCSARLHMKRRFRRSYRQRSR